MSKHIFGLIITHHGTAANNRGETEGNITTLQKLLWNGDVHTTVSAEAIRFGIRWYWQRQKDIALNRTWDDDASTNRWGDETFANWKAHVDDDLLGFMSAKAAKEEGNEAESKSGKKTKARGTVEKRRGRLELTRAISLTPFAGDITFNAASPGATPSASSTGSDPVPYGTEMHATRYQYGFALTPEDLADPKRALHAIDAVVNLAEVAGNQARFLFDFSPESIILRWTDDFAPRMLYGFVLQKDGSLALPSIAERVNSGDINPEEMILGGSIASSPDGITLKDKGVFAAAGIKQAAEELKERVVKDLGLA